MGFLSKHKVPNELPDLAIENHNGSAKSENSGSSAMPRPVDQPIPISEKPETGIPNPPQKHLEGEHYLKFDEPKNSPPTASQEIKQKITESMSEEIDPSQNSFFNEILDDINTEIEDLGKLENWYENKVAAQDMISNMKGYWEGNKSDIIVKTFGSEYKSKVNKKIKGLQKLEEDWREIYFRLIKKEEEMKKEERELKSILSEFVNLCKTRTADGKKEKTDKKEGKSKDKKDS